MKLFTILITLAFQLLCFDASAETCSGPYHMLKDYVPERLAKFIPLKKIFCTQEPLENFQIPPKLKKYYDEMAEDTEMLPLDITKYSFETPLKPVTNETSIDLAKENGPVSRALRFIETVDTNSLHLAIIVPGYTPEGTRDPVQLDDVAKERVDLGVRYLISTAAPVIIFTGGNVQPEGTPFNEAMEMKKYAMARYHVPEYMIAIDPYARHSTTNLRNAGRFMLAHEITKGLIVTTPKHNLYFGYSKKSTLEERAKKTLGYLLGRLEFADLNTTRFFPSQDVFKKATDQRDP